MGKPLVLIGIALVIAGAVLLGYLGLLVFQVIDSPQDVPLVKFIVNHMRVEDKAIYGHAGADTFEIHVSEPARTVILLFLASFVLMVLAGVAKSLISAGINLVSTGGRIKNEPSGSRGSPGVVRTD